MTEQFHLSRLQVINWGVFDGYHSIPFSERRRTDRRRLRQRQILTAGRDFAGLPAVQPAQLQRLRRQHRRRVQRGPPHRRQVRARRLGSAQRRRHQPGDVPARRRHRVVGGRGHLHQQLPGAPSPAWCSSGSPANPARTRRAGSCSADGDLDIEDVCNRWAARPFRLRGVQGRRVAVLHQGGVAVPRSAVRDHRHPRLRRRPAAARQGQVAEKCWRAGAVRARVHARRARAAWPGCPRRSSRSTRWSKPANCWPSRRSKRKILGDIEKIQQRYASESSDLGIIDLVDAADGAGLHRPCPAGAVPRRRSHRLTAPSTSSSNEYEDVTRSLNLAKAEADSLNAQISGSSASIGPLQSQVAAAETEAEQVSRRRAAYEDLLTAQDVDDPGDRPTSSGTCARTCSPRPPSCSPRSNATARPPPTPSTRRRRRASPATTPPRNSSASSTSDPRCRSSRWRCANTSAPQSASTPASSPTSPS